MKEKFILINGRILDYKEYMKDCRMMKRLLQSDIESCCHVFGFEKRKEGTYHCSQYDLVLKVSIEKKNKDKFI